MNRRTVWACVAGLLAAGPASAGMIEYSLSGTTDTVVVFGSTWSNAVTGDPWEFVVTIDDGIPEDSSTRSDPQAYRLFDSVVSAWLTVGPDTAPLALFADDLIFEDKLADSIFFTAFEPGGGTVTVQMDGPPSVFGTADMPMAFDPAGIAAATFSVNIFVNGEIGILGTSGGSLSATLVPAPSGLALLGVLGLARRRR